MRDGAAHEDGQAPATVPSYLPPASIGVPRLGRGLVWSDLVAEMEAEHEVRLRKRAAAAELAEVTRLGLPRIGGTDRPDTAIGEAA